MKRILITGANGFVGKSLAEYLSQDVAYDVIPANRKMLNLLDSNSVADFFNSTKPDVVIHTANQGGSRITGYDVNSNSSAIMSNLIMLLNLKSNLDDNIKLITFGSGAEYNKARDLKKVSENKIGEIPPADEYGLSKLVIKEIVDCSKNISSPIIFGLFGKHEDYRFKFISNSIIKNILKLPIVINQNVIFDYLYIDDFNKIIKLLIDNNYDLHSFNITPTESISLVEIANIINEISDFKSEIIIKNSGLNYEYTGANDLLLSKIGGYSFLSYHESISHLYNHFKSVINTIDYKEILDDEYIKNCKTKN